MRIKICITILFYLQLNTIEKQNIERKSELIGIKKSSRIITRPKRSITLPGHALPTVQGKNVASCKSRDQMEYFLKF